MAVGSVFGQGCWMIVLMRERENGGLFMILKTIKWYVEECERMWCKITSEISVYFVTD